MQRNETRRRWLLPAILAVAALIRIAHFTEIATSPCARHDRWDETDMHTYDVWARQIGAGDVWTDRALHPLHQGHHDVARHLLGHDPTEAETARLWEPWFGGKTFHAEPLYPYLIAATYALLGPDPLAVFVWQSLIGLAIVFGLYRVTAHQFDESTGIVAAVLAALYGPLLFYELVLLRTTLISFAGIALVWLLNRALKTDGRRRWVVCGSAIGVAILLKSVFAAWLPAALLVAALNLRGRHLGRAAAALTIGTLIGVAPAVVRNVVVGVPPLALNSINSSTFIMANSRGYDPVDNRVDHAAVARILDRTGGRLLPTVVATLGTHDTPGSYALLLWRKFESVWNWHEMPNNANFYHHRIYSLTLRVLPTFLMLAPLALVGLALAAPRWRAAAPLYLLVGTHLFVMLIALNQSRYRLPLVVALVPFAALTVTHLLHWIRQRRLRPAAATMAVVVLLALWVGRSPVPRSDRVRDADALALLDWHRRESGVDGTRAYLLTVLRAAPQRVGTLLVLGDLERNQRNHDRAERYYRRVLEQEHRNPYALSGLARIYLEQGRRQELAEIADALRGPD